MKNKKDKSITGKFLSDILYKKRLINDEQLEKILKIQKNSGDDLQKIIIDLGILKKDEMMLALADEIGVNYLMNLK